MFCDMNGVYETKAMSKCLAEIHSEEQSKLELSIGEIKVEAIIKQEPNYPEDVKIEPEEYIQNYKQLQNEQIEDLNALDDVICDKELVTVKLEDIWTQVGRDNEVNEYNLQDVMKNGCEINIEGFDSEGVTSAKDIQVNLITHSKDLQLSGSKNSDRSVWYNCNFCKFRARSKEYIKWHKYLHHTDSRMYQCSYCRFETKHQIYLTHHLLTNHKKWHYCRFCKYKTKQEAALTKHYEKHNKSFVCNLCNFKTELKYCLESHMKAMHNAWYVRNIDNKQEVIPVESCSSDGFELRTENVQMDHPETNTKLVKDQKNNCKLCPFRTISKDFLKYHIEQHHSMKHHCALCGYKTGAKSKLESHLKVDHYLDMEWFQCHRCDFKIKGKCNLVGHLKNAHNI